MFVIIEGTDAIGKTTAAKSMVARNADWHYQHMSRPPDDFDHFSDYARVLKARCVYDRFHLGALVYGNIITDQRQNTSLTRLIAVSRLIRFLGGVVIVMYSSSDAWLLEHLRTTDPRSAQMYARDQIMMANEVYRWLAQSMGVNGTQLVDLSHDVACGGFPSVGAIDMWREMTGQPKGIIKP